MIPLPLPLPLLVLFTLSTSTSALRTAVAVFHEDDGIYGSVIFHQYRRAGPLFISALLRDVSASASHPADWEIHTEPVHYDLHGPAVRCTESALRSVVRAGALGNRHGKIGGARFAEVLYDWGLSLYEGEDGGSVVNRSLVVRQGNGVAVCATIEETRVHRLRPGGVPCERVQYADCLVATGRENVCVYRPCEGYRRVWGEVEDETQFCGRKWERFPKRRAEGARKGVVECDMGSHSLLRPLEEEGE